MNPLTARKKIKHTRLVTLIENSPLRGIDPRVKLGLSTLVAVTVMLPVEKLALFWLIFVGLMFPARLAGEVFHQMRRILWILVILFIVDWYVVDLRFAILITLRFTLLVSAFVIFFATTRPEEFRLALERLRVPYRYAFSLSLALFSLTTIREEWQAIREAQHSRGTEEEGKGFKRIGKILGNGIALGVPTVVLTVKRAWMLTEAAHVRGFDSPARTSYYHLAMKPRDWGLLLTALSLNTLLFIWH